MSSSRFPYALTAVLFGGLAVPGLAELPAARQTELAYMVRQDCGSCHGMTLRGGLGLPLLPETLADKPVEGLVATIMGGRPGTPMPSWRRFLSEDEALWFVERLMAGFPE